MSLLLIAAFPKSARNHCSVAINRIPVPDGQRTTDGFSLGREFPLLEL